ncbi:MAG: AAA family ATPase [Spirochaetaceae bacterium]|jgi:cytidylate kinase|nr:AAA family ATPase [Spirochaetaceae bacterium]
MKTIRDLKKQIRKLSDFQATQEIIILLSEFDDFKRISLNELNLLEKRDEEDREKLRKGIIRSLRNGVIKEPDYKIEWVTVPVDNKLPDVICNEVLSKIDLNRKGITITICGDSGVGKGTLVSHLEKNLPNCKKWSNGDIFRLITFLVLNQLGKDKVNENDLEEINFTELVKLVEINDKNEIIIESDGKTLYLEKIKNGLLKEDPININLPTIAKCTQGEVVLIANRYIRSNNESIILAEGRKETLDYVHSDYRFEIKMINKGELGQRRTSQKILQMIKNLSDDSLSVEKFLRENYR